LVQVLDGFAVQRTATEDHLEAVELGWVVRPGHLDAAITLQRLDRKVQRRCRHLADIDCGAASRDDTATYPGSECCATGAIVAPYRERDGAAELLLGDCGDTAAQRLCKRRRELAVDYAADIVLPEDRVRNLHTSSSG